MQGNRKENLLTLINILDVDNFYLELKKELTIFVETNLINNGITTI